MKQNLLYDIKLQWRQGFWGIYFILSLAFLIIIFSISPENRQMVSSLFILTDTSMLGIIFVGALILFEKQQNLMQSLFVTPLRLQNYLLSKTLSLGLLVLIMSLFIYLPTSPFNSRIFIIIPIVVLTSTMFTLMGLGISARVKSINQYFGFIIAASMLIVVPAAMFLLINAKWLIIFPYNAAIDLLLNPIENLSVINILTDGLLLTGWTFVSYLFAYRQFEKHVLNQ